MNELASSPHVQKFRLKAGGLVDRTSHLNFRFDGKDYAGHNGDTLASALLASGVRLVGRSFKYHRPRGIMTAGPEEPNALVQLRTRAFSEPNTKATTTELFDGLVAESQNRFPSLAFDMTAVTGLLSPFFAAGFYYKTFMWPASFWEKVYEPLIRRAAGLGRASALPDPDSYEKAFAFCDVLIVGAGPAGLAAALAAGRSGARVILADEDFRPGGRLLSEHYEIDDLPGHEWAEAALAELLGMPNLAFMPRTTVFGAFDGQTFGAIERVADHVLKPAEHTPRQRLWKIVAKSTVVAAGAMERPIVFNGNDRPGVMTASAVRSYVNRFGVVPGQRAVIFTANDDGWRTAIDLSLSGVELAAIVDVRKEVDAGLPDEIEGGKPRIFLGGSIVSTSGRTGLRSVRVRDADGKIHTVEADLVANSAAWVPSIGLSTHRGHKPSWSEETSCFKAADSVPGMAMAGAAGGLFGLSSCLADGFNKGARAAQQAGFKVGAKQTFKSSDEAFSAVPFWFVDGKSKKAFVDFQHDVTKADIELALREGYESVEHVKRYTTLGMATDQGKTSNLNGHAIVASTVGKAIQEVGATTMRPPYVPVAIGAFAGHSRGKEFRPNRLTASHTWADAHGADFVETGQWMRARWFVKPGETDWRQSVDREVIAVRNNVGVCDVSTLGKIDVQGSDAGAFLDRVYINTFSTLPVGKTRYGLMLREDGFAMDDGTAARFGDDHFVVSTTTANAAKVMQHLEHARQVIWPELNVQLTSVTEQWAQYSIAGPNARMLLQKLFGSTIDLDNEAFPFMACREFEWAGTTCRLFRVSFSGELAYEIAVPARFGEAALEALITAGEKFGVIPYGTEALGVMRIEKGHAAGNEINGMTTAGDLGLGRMMSTKKDFIGKVLSQRPGLIDPERPLLVGFKPVKAEDPIGVGAHFVGIGKSPSATTDEGYMTSVCFSPTLGHMIGLGFVKRGPERIGERVRAYDPVRGRDTVVEICNPVFVDREGKRTHA